VDLLQARHHALHPGGPPQTSLDRLPTGFRGRRRLVSDGASNAPDSRSRGYETWLRKPVRGLEWGETDRAIVIMEPLLGGGGPHVIELRRHLGEPDGTESSIDLQLAHRQDRTPGIHRLPGRVVEALDEPPALWIGGQLRGEPAIVGALAHDWPFMALLRVDDALVRVGKRSQGPQLPIRPCTRGPNHARNFRSPRLAKPRGRVPRLR